jgi:hypothetical protein
LADETSGAATFVTARPEGATPTEARSADSYERQEHEEEHGEEARSKDVEGEAAGEEGEEVKLGSGNGG